MNARTDERRERRRKWGWAGVVAGLAASKASAQQLSLDPAGSGPIVNAVHWIQGTLLGTVVTVVAVIPVATVGILMLTGRMNWRYGATINFNLPYPQEQIWVLYGPNDIAFLGVHGKKVGNLGQNSGQPPRPGYQAIIHTHPSWANYAPGPGDFGQSVPLYGIAPDGAWVIRPGATSATALYGMRP